MSGIDHYGRWMKIKKSKYRTENVPVRLVTKMFAVEVIFSLEKIKPNKR